MATKKQAGIRARKNADGSMSYDAQLLVKPYPRTQQTFAIRDQAIAWRLKTLAELRAQRKVGRARPEMAKLTIAGLNTEYLNDPETMALADFKDRERHLNWWSAHYGGERVLDFGTLQARAARAALIPGRKNATVVRYIAAERAAWNWGRAADLVPNDRVWPQRLMLTEPDARVRWLSDDELRDVMQAAKAHSPAVYAAVAVALATGARQGEMLRLTWGDVDFERSTIRLLLTKARVPRSVHLPAIAAEALKAVKADDAADDARVFLYSDGTPLDQDRLNREWRRVRTAAGLDHTCTDQCEPECQAHFRWHDFRHSCASFLAQNGATLLEIGSILGHKRAQTTLKYAHLVAGKVVTGHAALDQKLRDGAAS
jgi:integrase